MSKEFTIKYPKTVRVGRKDYSVVFTPLKKTLRGECDPKNKVILIDSNMSERQALSTFIHELIHAMEFEHRIKLKHKSVYGLETAILLFLQANPNAKLIMTKQRKGSRIKA